MQSGIEGSDRHGSSFQTNAVEGNLMTANDPARAEKAFEKVRAQIKARVGGEVYSSWFGRMKVDEYSKGLVRLSVPTAFLRSWINGHYLDLITELWK
ncbi:MAG: chromosomal replication initiator protein DnaA, partial [Rhizobiales bacterium]|nr:chromosomal replication initiator protein DnaA [Hyphomicrobiales bacterium]